MNYENILSHVMPSCSSSPFLRSKWTHARIQTVPNQLIITLDRVGRTSSMMYVTVPQIDFFDLCPLCNVGSTLTFAQRRRMAEYLKEKVYYPDVTFRDFLIANQDNFVPIEWRFCRSRRSEILFDGSMLIDEVGYRYTPSMVWSTEDQIWIPGKFWKSHNVTEFDRTIVYIPPAQR